MKLPFLALVCLAFVLAACGTLPTAAVPCLSDQGAAEEIEATDPQSEALGDPERPYPPSREPVTGDVLHVATGLFVNAAESLKLVTDSRVVYIGESHDNPEAHRVELDVLKAMAARYPGKVALGMEMFVTSQQPVLDRWVAGELDEKDFVKESDWYDVWSMNFELYRDLLLFARDNQLPIVALNAEQATVHTVVRTELGQLEPAIAAQLPEMDSQDPYQRALVAAIFGGHAMGGGKLDGFFRVQTLWDETMAQNVARTLQREGNEDLRMVVLAGGYHVRNGFGMPRRVFRRVPHSYTLVGIFETNVDEDSPERYMDVEMPRFPNIAYDYEFFVEFASLKEAKLGALLNEANGAVKLESILPGSPAELAGLAPGDQIVKAGGVDVNESFDLTWEVGRRKVGEVLPLEVKRGDETLTADVTLDVFDMGKHGEPKAN